MAQLKVASQIRGQHSPVIEKAVPVNIFNADSIILLKPVLLLRIISTWFHSDNTLKHISETYAPKTKHII
jgi:hypothetical protein